MSKLSDRINLSSGGTNTILNGIIDPTAGEGSDGDFFINTADNTLFGPKAAGAWGPATSLVGGSSLGILSGTIDPIPSEGLNGQYYINTVDNTLFGPKTGGAWGNAQPMAGIGTLITGITDPLNSLGNDGDFYTNTATNTLFGPKVGGTWPGGVSLLGPFGGSAPTVINNGGTVIIADGDVNPDISDGTYQDAYQSYDENYSFMLQNSGPATLSAISISLSNPDFTVSTAPSASLGSFATTSFSITVNTAILGTNDCTVTVNNDSAGTPAYSFLIRAEAVVLPTAIFVEKTGSDSNSGFTPSAPVLTLTKVESLLDTMVVPVPNNIQVIFGPGEWNLPSEGSSLTINADRWDTVTFVGDHLGAGQLDSSDVTISASGTLSNFQAKLGTTLDLENRDIQALGNITQAKIAYKDIILRNSDPGNGSSDAGLTSTDNVGIINVIIHTSGIVGNEGNSLISVQDTYAYMDETFYNFEIYDNDGTCTVDFDNVYVYNPGDYPSRISVPGNMNNCTFDGDRTLEIDLSAGTLNIIDCLFDSTGAPRDAIQIGTKGGAGLVNIVNSTFNAPTNYASIRTHSNLVLTDCTLNNDLDIFKTELPAIYVVLNGTCTIGAGDRLFASGLGVDVDLTNWDNAGVTDLIALNGAQIDVNGAPTTGSYAPTYGSGPDANGSEIF